MVVGYILILIFIVIGCIISSFIGVLPAMLFILAMGIVSLIANIE